MTKNLYKKPSLTCFNMPKNSEMLVTLSASGNIDDYTDGGEFESTFIEGNL